MENLQNLNQNIKKIRKDKNLSQEDIACGLDISQEAYRKIEGGQTKLTLDRLAQIGDIFGMDLVEMITYGNEKYRIGEVKDQGTGVNAGTINHGHNKNLETRVEHLEETVHLLTHMMDKLLGSDKE